MTGRNLAEVAVDARFPDRRMALTYTVPESLSEVLAVGQLVWVPLQRRIVIGVICELHQREVPGDVTPRPLHAPVEPGFRLSTAQWELAVWIAEETISTIYEAASLMFPPGVETHGIEHLELVSGADIADPLTPLQQRLVTWLQSHPDATVDAARRGLDSPLTSVIPALENTGVLRRVVRVRDRQPQRPRDPEYVRLIPDAEPPPARAPRQVQAYEWLSARLRTRPDGILPLATATESELIDRQVLRALADRGCIAIERRPPDRGPLDESRIRGPNLTSEQQLVWERIHKAMSDGVSGRFLLHGVTGSGKTEVYFRAATAAMGTGRSAILLVPEIALASQVVERAVERFGTRAIVLHSALNEGQRYDNWQRCASGEPVIVVGPRSALFAPLPKIGLVVVDEEHEAAYKQDNSPRYHARNVAAQVAQIHGATLILGSATPDVESYHHAQTGTWTMLKLNERVGQRTIDTTGRVSGSTIALPDVSVIDMRAELRDGNRSLFSRELVSILEERLKRREQSILFLNRRGSSTMVQCRSCGAVVSCPQCDIPMVYHRAGERLICHRCGHCRRTPDTCEECGSREIGYYGAGTQRVEAEVRKVLPRARIQRWDRDVLRGKVTHETLLGRIQRHEVDIVVGTQVVAKGLDLPDVTAVGVVNADTFLHLPDFRAAERTFQMLTQVAGRAGRRSGGADVVIQSYSPDHYTIQHAARHDYPGFYRDEISFRRQHGYPPFKRIVRLLYRHTDDVEANIAANALCTAIEDEIERSRLGSGVDVLGPAPAFAARLRGRYGWQILVRGDSAPALLANMAIPFGWAIDVDPVSLL